MASQGGQIQQPAKGPYIPTNWSLGGTPEKSVDIPITAVLLVFYICGAVANMTILQLNNRRGHKFLMSGALFGFCMARTTTCVLRIASVCYPHNIRLAIAAQVFVAAGVLLIFVINLIFTQRIIRAQHPHIGWHKSFHIVPLVLYVLIVITLAMIITVVVQSFFTLRPETRRIDRDIQLYAATFFAFISFLPIPLNLISLALPNKAPAENFGNGRFRTKYMIVMTGAFLLSSGAIYRMATSYKTPVPRSQPLPGYFSKACFYIFNFVVEILVLYLYILTRIDRRFHIPNGAKGPGSYTTSPKSASVEDVDGQSKEALKDEEEGA